MIIAIPLFGERVSPHFSTAPELLVVLAREQSIRTMMRFHFAQASLPEKKKRIVSLGVETLVCGGIDRATRGWFEKRGIRVMPNAVGEAEEILTNRLGLSKTGGRGKPEAI